MSQIPVDLKYTKTHEWARLNPDGSVTVGITDHAQIQLGDMVFVELPKLGRVGNRRRGMRRGGIRQSRFRGLQPAGGRGDGRQ